MSGLARLLAGRAAPGVYHWTSAASVDDIRHAVERAHWQFVLLDTWTVEEKAGFMAACQSAFDLPASFAGNFDALADALSDLRPASSVSGDEPQPTQGRAEDGDCEGLLVVWDGWGPLARAERRVFDVAVDVFSARVDDERAAPFTVLLRGPGPADTELVELDPHGPANT
jgi:hypothetical protein